MSLPYGAAQLIDSLSSESATPVVPRLFTLVSVPLLAKYTGPLAPLAMKANIMFSDVLRRIGGFPHVPAPNLPQASPTGEALPSQKRSRADIRRMPSFVSGVTEYRTALRAMMQHRSQLVWFRWLYVAFSRYMWVNELVEVVPPTASDKAEAALT